MKQILFCLMVALLVLSTPGCLGQAQEQNTTNDTIVPPPAPPVKTPTFTISSPSNDEIVTVSDETGDATLLLNTQNLIVKAPGGAAKKGEGHFRVTIDGGTPQTVNSKTYLMTGLRLGEHTVRVELLNNDRTPYSPAISSEVTFTIQKEAPREYIQQNYKVTIRDFTYEPASITVKVKDTVTFVNNGAFPRSATCFINGKEVFDTKIISPGQNATVTFTEIMECEYYATTHRLMTGRIKVVSNGVD